MSKDIRFYFSQHSNNDITPSNSVSEKNIESIKAEAFTDGSAINNGKQWVKAGIGVYFPDKSLNLTDISISCNKFINNNPVYGIQKATNNVAELLAILFAIEKLLEVLDSKECPIVIYSDSEYSINCVTKWAIGWKRAGWKKKGKNSEIKNLEIIKRIFNYCEKYRVKFVHINSHKAEPFPKGGTEWMLWYGNDMADKLAVKGAKGLD